MVHDLFAARGQLAADAVRSGSGSPVLLPGRGEAAAGVLGGEKEPRGEDADRGAVGGTGEEDEREKEEEMVFQIIKRVNLGVNQSLICGRICGGGCVVTR